MPYVIGAALPELQRLPSESVHCFVTSPPYWGLRDYGAEGQLGLEPTPDAYVERLVGILAEARRVLRSDGTLWLNLGDSYAGGTTGRNDSGRDIGGRGGNYKGETPGKPMARAVPLGIKPKDLVGIPWRVAFALQADGWWLRSDVIWHKPNPMPESVTDRPTCAHEYVFLLTKAARYFYDADAVREDAIQGPHTRSRAANFKGVGSQSDKFGRHNHGAETIVCDGGRNKRTVWTIATRPYPEAHFATFPEQLVTPCILAGTSAKGCCSECGAPWVREVDVAPGKVSPRAAEGQQRASNGAQTGGSAKVTLRSAPRGRKTTGWAPQCHCNAAVVPCTVGDPFLGSGTVGAVAAALGRRWWGCELNPDYEPLIRRRTAQMGLFAGGTAA